MDKGHQSVRDTAQWLALISMQPISVQVASMSWAVSDICFAGLWDRVKVDEPKIVTYSYYVWEKVNIEDEIFFGQKIDKIHVFCAKILIFSKSM